MLTLNVVNYLLCSDIAWMRKRPRDMAQSRCLDFMRPFPTYKGVSDRPIFALIKSRLVPLLSLLWLSGSCSMPSAAWQASAARKILPYLACNEQKTKL